VPSLFTKKFHFLLALLPQLKLSNSLGARLRDWLTSFEPTFDSITKSHFLSTWLASTRISLSSHFNALKSGIGVASFFLLQHTKLGKTFPNHQEI
jgi:hypothetical protein